MTIYKMTYKLMSLFAGTLLAVSLGGCLDDHSECIEDRPGYQEGNDLWMSFQIQNMSGTARTRAGEPEDADGHPDEAGTYPENYIDVNDLTLLFLDNQQRVWKVFDKADLSITQEKEDYTRFRLVFKINKDYFGYASGQKNVNYSLMVVANLNGLKGAHDTFGGDLFMKTPAAIAGMYKSFTMPDQSAKLWEPSKADNLIPMAGISTGSFESSALDNAVENGNAIENPIKLGDVYMQRCLAKIRVLDAIPLQEETPEAKITSVKLIGGNTKGAYIPNVNKDWFSGTTVVETATEQADWYKPAMEVPFINTGTAQQSVADNEDITYPNELHCYVPESVVTGRDTKLVITVDYGNNDIVSYDVKLGEAYGNGNGNTYQGITDIARNHIYEYIVRAVRTPSIKYTVCEWATYTVDVPPFN